MDRTRLYSNVTATTANACTKCSGMVGAAPAPLQSQHPAILASALMQDACTVPRGSCRGEAPVNHKPGQGMEVTKLWGHPKN